MYNTATTVNLDLQTLGHSLLCVLAVTVYSRNSPLWLTSTALLKALKAK